MRAPVPRHPDPLAAAVGELTELADEQDRAALAALTRRLADQRLRVLVTGEAKRGKSTLVNALLHRAVLPTGVTPLTALATTVLHGTEEKVTATLTSGQNGTFPLAALDDLVTERGNPGNRKNLASVTVTVDAPLLARGVELVDTPGTGSVYRHNTREAESALATMDAAVLVLSADPPVSASERELIGQVASLSVTMFVVLNKADHLSGPELAEVLAFTERVVAEAAGRPARIYPASARTALTGPGDPGFAEFERDFTAYLATGRLTDLRRSAAAHARRIAASLRDEAALARRAAQLRGTQAARRVREFAGRLAAVRERATDAADLATTESGRMLAALNTSAQDAGRQATARVTARLDDLLAGELAALTAAEIERDGRARLSELAVSQAEDWRRERAGMLEAGLAALDEKLTGALRAELDAVRRAASDLLDLDLAVPAPGGRLAPDLRFFYVTAAEPGQTELLAGALRRHLPGEPGRRRARGHLRREAAELVPMQIGRARADLQYRLAEAARRLARVVGERYDEGTGRLTKALDEAAGLRAAASDEVAARDQRLEARMAALDHVLELLDAAGGTS